MNRIFMQMVEREFDRAEGLHPKLNSAHEAYAVILEELDEFKAEVWKKSGERNASEMVRELAQVAAMCVRTACNLPELRSATAAEFFREWSSAADAMDREATR